MTDTLTCLVVIHYRNKVLMYFDYIPCTVLVLKYAMASTECCKQCKHVYICSLPLAT